ncbi:MAG: disulfide bond formation protein B [Rhodospirillales bacterium]|nr:disulfide bond formation protein B [Rhodospirillales bacterium]
MNLPLLIPLGILAASVGALGSAYTAQYGFDLEPCILCLYQRVPFLVTGLLALVALRVQPGSTKTVFVGLAGVVFLVGAGIAAYQVGVEQHWWASGCSGGLPENLSIADMKQILTQKQPKPCDDVDWTLFGVSMATYNVFYSGLLGLGSLAAAYRMRSEA